MQRDLRTPPLAHQPLRRGVVGRGEIALVQNVEPAQRQRGICGGLPLQSHIEGGVRPQLQGIGVVGIAFADMAQTS